VAAVALLLRVGTVLLLSTEHHRPLAYEHGRIAENLLAGRGFTIEYLGVEGPTSQQAPFYPFFLAAIYAVTGVGTPAAVLAAQLIQCLAGTALVLAVIWLGWSLLPDRPAVGWLAGMAATVYPPHVYAVTHLQVALWAALLLTTLLAVVAAPRWRGSWRGALLAGALSGMLLLVEPILALALPVVAGAFLLGQRRPAAPWLTWPALAKTAALAAVAGLLICPWLVRNRLVHGEWVFIKSSFGYAFWQGNHPLSWGTDKIPKPAAEAARQQHDGTLAGMDRALWEARHKTLYIDDVLLKPGGYAQFQGLSEPQRSRLLQDQALEAIRQDPGLYLRHCLNRLRYFLLFDETNPKAANQLYRASTAIWFTLTLVGLLATGGAWRQLWPTYAVFGLVTLFHTLVITAVRFRIPLEPLSLVWAAGAIAPVLARLFVTPPIPVRRPGEIPRDPFHGPHVLRGPHFLRTKRQAASLEADAERKAES